MLAFDFTAVGTRNRPDAPPVYCSDVRAENAESAFKIVHERELGLNWEPATKDDENEYTVFWNAYNDAEEGLAETAKTPSEYAVEALTNYRNTTKREK